MSSRDSVLEPRAAAPGGKLLDWADRIARLAIRHSARRAPPPLSERLEEEWLADLEARPRGLSRVRLGIGCYWAATVIVHEHFATGVATASATGNKTMVSYAQDESSFFSRRAMALIFIVCLHITFFYALATGLTHKVFEGLPPIIHASVTEEFKPRNQPPPPPPPEFRQHPFVIPDPEVPLLGPSDPDPSTIRDVITQDPPGPPVPPSPPPRTVNRVAGGPGKGFPNTEDYYPPAAIRLGEMGTTAVQVCVNSMGRLTADPVIAQSSGSTRIDEGAQKLARAGSGHYRPSTEDGRPVDSCYAIRVTFKLRN